MNITFANHGTHHVLMSITLLENHSQVIGYMNQVYLSCTPPDQKLFREQAYVNEGDLFRNNSHHESV